MDVSGYTHFVQSHNPQLISSGIPEQFWLSLYYKLTNGVFDASATFKILLIEDNESEGYKLKRKVIIASDEGVSVDDHSQIYLIDHAWTYEACRATFFLKSVDGLLNRMVDLMQLNDSKDPVTDVEKTMWKYNQTYSISSATTVENRMPLWYIMDEFGSSIQHSDEPNFRAVPFIYAAEGVAFTVLYPISNCKEGDEVTRDYVEGIDDPMLRKALLYPWNSSSFRNINFSNITPDEEYFYKGRLEDTLPVDTILSTDKDNVDKVLHVYSEYKYIVNYLTHPKFKIVTDPESADILWYTHHFRDYKKLSEESPNKFINQFPFEQVITVKDLLYYVCQSASNSSDDTFEWLLTTYNLKTELPQFISYFQNRMDLKLNNIWICKPWNLARGLDTIITDNLDCVLRLATSGPKIAQKYIENPVLFLRNEIGEVKFDVRYVILLKSVSPLQAYVYKNFFLRFSNEPFNLDDFSNYEKHFTVMNYSENTSLHKMLCPEFIEKFESQQGIKWSDIEKKIFKMLKQMFTAACSSKPPCGIPHSPQSRAVYAVDLMLSNDYKKGIIPKLLEVNWMPDCRRACEYYPDFYNDVFSLLFLNVCSETMCQL